jgi:hypothetical protein
VTGLPANCPLPAAAPALAQNVRRPLINGNGGINHLTYYQTKNRFPITVPALNDYETGFHATRQKAYVLDQELSRRRKILLITNFTWDCR